MAAVVAGPMTLDEFLDGNHEQSELFGGEVRPKPVPTLVPARMEKRLDRIFEKVFGEGCAIAEVSLRIGEESPVSDLMVFRSNSPALYRERLKITL